MPKIGRISDLVKAYVERRGGTRAAKQDLENVQKVMRDRGSLADKARRSVDVLKTPKADPETIRRPDGGHRGIHPAAPRRSKNVA